MTDENKEEYVIKQVDPASASKSKSIGLFKSKWFQNSIQGLLAGIIVGLIGFLFTSYLADRSEKVARQQLKVKEMQAVYEEVDKLNKVIDGFDKSHGLIVSQTERPEYGIVIPVKEMYAIESQMHHIFESMKLTYTKTIVSEYLYIVKEIKCGAPTSTISKKVDGESGNKSKRIRNAPKVEKVGIHGQLATKEINGKTYITGIKTMDFFRKGKDGKSEPAKDIEMRAVECCKTVEESRALKKNMYKLLADMDKQLSIEKAKTF